MDNRISDEQIRELYWFSKHSVEYIIKNTGLKIKDIIIIAKPLEMKCPLCGNIYIVKNRTERGGADGDLKECLRTCNDCYKLAYEYLSFSNKINNRTRESWDHSNDVNIIFEYFKKVGVEFAINNYNNIMNYLKENLFKIKQG